MNQKNNNDNATYPSFSIKKMIAMSQIDRRPRKGYKNSRIGKYILIFSANFLLLQRYQRCLATRLTIDYYFLKHVPRH